MITAEQKPLEEIKKLVGDAEKILVLGCGTCVTVCFAGGTKEVGILASSLRMATKLAGAPRQFDEETVQRQCEWEYIDPLEAKVHEYDLVLSLACGIGVQAMAERFADVPVIPGVNTTFLGMPTEPGVFEERCQACGDCILGLTGGICPIARCSKQLLNGPCGGSQNGVCEVDPDIPCVWQLIYDRMAERNQLDLLNEIMPPKNWSTSRDGGLRRIIREDLRNLEEGD
jgi:ferredoxin